MEEFLSFDNLLRIYTEHIIYKPNVGVDKVGKKRFENNLINEFELIKKKASGGNYCFSSYKLILIPKGVDKKPRKICIPTIRDKVMLMALKEMVTKEYTNEIGISRLNCKSVQRIVEDIKREIRAGKYDTFIKLDITSFYDNIDHDILIDKLKKDIDNEKILKLIQNAISRKQVYERYQNDVTIGVPQGLAVSNILANIYLDDLDKKYSNMDILYNRYVDDILILCNSKESDSIKKKIIRELKMRYFLDVNPDKCQMGSISDGVTYLGYEFKNGIISVRDSSKRRLENAIEDVFIKFTNTPKELQNIERLLWILNLKITGGIFEKKKYGWMFFYSQITDESLLYHMDSLMKKYLKRFGLNELDGKVKKFSKTYYEIIKNLDKTKYIPKFDNYSMDEKKFFLTKICKKDISNLTDDKIESLFRSNIFKKLDDLEKDLQFIS